VVMCFNQEGSVPLETIMTEAHLIDKHYVLSESGRRILLLLDIFLMIRTEFC